MSSERKPGSGGFRPGSGRKSKGYVTMTANVPVETREQIRQLADGMGKSNGEAIAYAVEQLVRQLAE